MKKILVLLLSLALLFSLTACGNKETETVDKGNAAEKFADIEWTMENGVLTIRGEGMMPNYEGPSGSVDDSEKLPPWYNARDDIKKVVIEKGITSIGDLAFLKCKNLTEVEIPDSVKSLGEGTFQFCESLTAVEIPEDITRIGGGTFFGCQNLKTMELPDTVKQIEMWAFADCKSLTTIEIRKNVREIGVHAFESSGLMNIKVAEDNNTYQDIDGVLYTKENKTLLVYPPGRTEASYGISEGTVAIENSAFQHCESLTAVEIPESMVKIGDKAFRYCENLVSIEIPDNVAEIGAEAFSDCSSLLSVEIPDNVTEIGTNAFGSCDNLTICGASGSYAEKYAEEKDIPFEAN